eukprot:gnl/TRDRNA2_/TRDRNA2_173155_c0_seq1.p1 gnl/TRDRNA2_/TRDRNA2_173155_c0~~gnl/TRDRNA2_/TRDRNA2_173155_c0_seq1.p1  ORF type:complete len:140 (-),score=3.80 gnl/TRDRNA2_/TRDRNA2_173155_c0_seq1:8-427(-)
MDNLVNRLVDKFFDRSVKDRLKVWQLHHTDLDRITSAKIRPDKSPGLLCKQSRLSFPIMCSLLHGSCAVLPVPPSFSHLRPGKLPISYCFPKRHSRKLSGITTQAAADAGPVSPRMGWEVWEVQEGPVFARAKGEPWKR